MSASTEVAKVRLVTIIAAAELLDGLEKRLKALGASGYTVTRTDGHGSHGPNTRGLMGAGNVRVESLLRAADAQSLFADLSSAYAGQPLTAFAHDVDAIPAAHFR